MLDNKQILIIRLSSIGDVLHTTPVAKTLKTAYPSCHITWIVSKTAACLLANNPYIDQVMIWSREEFEKAASNGKIGQLRKLWKQLKTFYQQTHFDIALDIHGLFLTGLMLYASKTPRRIGLANTRELNRFFMTQQAPATNDPHIIARYLSILQPLQINATSKQMTLNLSPESESFAMQFLLAHRIDPHKKILLINPKTSWTSKNWGDERFAKCISLLDDTVQIILCGGPQDRQSAQYIQALVNRPLINAAGRTTLLELAALIKKADLLLTGDTGSLHIAIAIKTPTISLWGPTKPEQYGPCTPEHMIMRSNHPCTGCHKIKCQLKTNDCMRSIDPDQVAKEIHTLLKKFK